MKNVLGSNKQGRLEVSLSGHIDSANVKNVEQELNAMLEPAPQSVVIDCGGLEYISSAGLRMLLRVKKTADDTRLVNVSSAVYEILDTTGFTEIMDIRRAMRTLSVEGCEVIGCGANGQVYRMDEETIVKEFHNADALENINRERELARTAFVLGIPTAISYDVVRLENGGYGAVYELLNAKSYAQLLLSGEKTVDELAEMSVELLRVIHSAEAPEGALPKRAGRVLAWFGDIEGKLDPAVSEKLRSLLDSIPDPGCALHGDFHVKNIMYMDGESLLIDMDTFGSGNPIFEFAAMYDAYRGFSETDHDSVRRFLGIDYDTAGRLFERSLELYLGGRGGRFDNAMRAVRILSAVHLCSHYVRGKDADPSEAAEKAEVYKRILEALVPGTDALGL